MKPTFEQQVIAKAYRMYLDAKQAEADERPLGWCSFCGAAYYDASERRWHEMHAECIGGEDRHRRDV